MSNRKFEIHKNNDNQYWFGLKTVNGENIGTFYPLASNILGAPSYLMKHLGLLSPNIHKH
jgi:hypothetical protein